MRFVREAGDAGVSGCLPGPWPLPKLGVAALCMHGPLRGPCMQRAERCFFRGACPRKKRILVGSAGCGRRKSATLALPGESVGTERPADVCGACPAGRVRWGGKAGGYLWGVPYRASPLERKGRRMPAERALPGQSVGAEGPADACGACPAGRVRWGGKAGGCLRSVPCRASPLGWRGRRKFATLFWSVVGMVFLQRAHVFVLGKNFLKLPHIWRGSFVIQGERGRSHHGLGGPI